MRFREHLCDDAPTGKWRRALRSLRARGEGRLTEGEQEINPRQLLQ
jgi:hypothetical protein